MNRFLTSAARIGGLATLTISLAACGPEDSVGHNPHFALAQTALAPADATYYPETLPLLPAATDYALAPSWDYAQSGFTDRTPTDPYDYGGYYEADNGGYYDDGADADSYGALALAALIAGVIGDSPPDYGFDYGGVQPWAWNTGDGYYRYAEPVSGGYRNYYYEPRAERPFLVRDPWYSYGYRDGRLATIYDRDGRVLRQRAAVRQRLAADRYYARAWDLRRAAFTDRHHGVSAPVWSQRRAVIAAEQRRWQQARAERAAWQRWDARHDAEIDRRWREERIERDRAARQFDDWRRDAYRGPAPRFYEAQRRERAERLAEQRQEQARSQAQQQRERAQRQAQQQRQEQAERLADQRREQAERQAQRARQAQQVEARQAQQQAAARRQAVVERRQVAERREQADRPRTPVAAAPASARRQDAVVRPRVSAPREQAAPAMRRPATEARQQPARARTEAQEPRQTARPRQAEQPANAARAREAAARREDEVRQQARADAQRQAAAREQETRARAASQQRAQARERQARAERAQQVAARRQQAAAPREQAVGRPARVDPQQSAAVRQQPARERVAERRENGAADRQEAAASR